MNAKEIIVLNNEKRKELTEENLAYYEDMLLYALAQQDQSSIQKKYCLNYWNI